MTEMEQWPVIQKDDAGTRFKREFTGLLYAFSLIFYPVSIVHADDVCNLNQVRINFKQLAPSTDADQEWVEVRVLQKDLSEARLVNVDGEIVAITASRHVESKAMEAPRDFTFRSGWVLNTQFAFRHGERLRIRERYDLPSGATFYALAPPGEPHLTIFARPDGTLCNKVMNTNAGDHGFLVREYKSTPATKLEMLTGEAQGEPLTLRIVYLGSSGGIASFREIWSRQGRIVQAIDHTFDPSARELQLGPVTLRDVVIAPGAISAKVIAPAPRIAINHYWSDKLSR